ncbi:hypothetical protein O1M54_25595 [Streptomyces diastatochromogenes]|nr:hypothetical protein [Streptomyces diastatochromogenes]
MPVRAARGGLRGNRLARRNRYDLTGGALRGYGGVGQGRRLPGAA